MQGNRITDPTAATRFMLAGDARLTLVSVKTGTRFTYRVSQCEDNEALWFVALMDGPDNESSFAYLGTIRLTLAGLRYATGRKLKVAETAPSVKAFSWFASMLLGRGEMSPLVEVWHCGKCCRCGRALTVPESIASGWGPECWKRAGASQFLAEAA